MVDSATESCIGSLRLANEELLKISEKTIFSLPLLQNVSSSTKGIWLQEEDLNFFRHYFKENQVDEKFNAIRNLNSSSIIGQEQNSGLTVKEKLIEVKSFMEKEVGKIKEKQALLESAIPVTLKRLNNSHIPVIKQSVI